jgi:hypothetical protein
VNDVKCDKSDGYYAVVLVSVAYNVAFLYVSFLVYLYESCDACMFVSLASITFCCRCKISPRATGLSVMALC